MQFGLSTSFLFLVFLISSLSSVNIYASDLEFKGNLLDRPCQIDPDSVIKDISFQDTAARLFFTWPGRSSEQSFQIKLINCHPMTIGKLVQLTFRGQEEYRLPGYLQVTGVNNGQLGIGIIDTDGTSLLALNSTHNKGRGDQVNENTITLKFKSFVQATQEAILNKSVTPGNYSATATFELSYK
ncbi:TPA: type 1 fimbrial protein [Escherichia coli]|nr:type 1 fimbrial protein [Escherichia coli]